MVKDVLVGRNLKGITDQEGFSLEGWPHPDLGALSVQNLERYLRRKKAVTRRCCMEAHRDLLGSTAQKQTVV